ncbi:S-layer homology domain-containing protein [Papillibacter cinnamivorans]|uniref:S-layer homology domain-containing protein n=1 Tax=Papillibacter cinnamivorans DSM 12816 TaxID=1122930 RepID=A0A1W2B9U4_9FIRM|nr:S-layer homology domain-containing protein [Papillibacter cinnamivorans]SMC69696.1 S-layer homology domain-containing protein [Papillibacter cinnamivorans DSM 12816]
MKKWAVPKILSFLLVLGILPTGALAALPAGVPASLEAPVIRQIELRYDDEGVPYFEAQVVIPQSVLDLDSESPGGGSVFWEYSEKIDNGAWGDYGGGGYLDVITETEEAVVTESENTFRVFFNPIDEGTLESIDIKNHMYTYKLRVYYDYYEGWPDVEAIYSPASNEMSIGSGSFYSDASAWAVPELQKASQYGLIPDILKGADMTEPITREEFCELAVLLYEKASRTEAPPASPNPFSDTENKRILKAYSLGITTGTSATTFSPKLLINREQCAAMLFRAIKAIAPDGEYGVTGVKDFPDQKYISSWASDAAKYMYKLGIIKGDTAGNFMPKATTTVQQAAGYGMATREAAVLMTVRTYEAMT